MAEPSDNLFIADLPAELDESQLQSVFEAYASIVSCKVLPPKVAGHLACAMMRVGSVDQAAWIVGNLNDNIPEGLTEPIKVRFANNLAGKGGGKGAALMALPPRTPLRPSHAAPAGGVAASNNLFVADLPGELDEAGLRAIFQPHGEIVSCKVLPPRQPGHGACAMVRFGSVGEASSVVDALNGNIPDGLTEPIKVRFANNPAGKGDAAPAAAAAPLRMPIRSSPYVGDVAAGEPPPSDNLFIADLPAELDESQLRSVFEAYGGIVSCRVLPPKAAGHFACAMVRFSSVDEAAWIVGNLNGNIPTGLTEPVKVRFANSPAGKGGGKGFGCGVDAATRPGLLRPSPYGGGAAAGPSPYGGGGKCASAQTLMGDARRSGILGAGRVPNECQLYIKNLPPDMTDLDLYRLFAPFGAAVSVKVMTEEDGSCKGFGFVDFAKEEDASLAASSLNGFTTTDGGSLHVSAKTSKPRQDRPGNVTGL